MDRKETMDALECAIEHFHTYSTVTVSCNDYFTDMLESALGLIKGKEVTPEYEGDSRNGYWWVCSECHTTLNQNDKYCRQCGGKVMRNA